MSDHNREAVSIDDPDRSPPKRFGQNGINEFFTCLFCYHEKPRGTTVPQYTRMHAGLTSRGVQIWCARHQTNIIHFDFENKTIRASDRVDDEDRAALQKRMPALAARLEETAPLDVIRAGLGVMLDRMARIGPLIRDGGEKSAAELLRAYSIELDRYLLTGDMSPDWKDAYDMIQKAREAPSIVIPGR